MERNASLDTCLVSSPAFANLSTAWTPPAPLPGGSILVFHGLCISAVAVKFCALLGKGLDHMQAPAHLAHERMSTSLCHYFAVVQVHENF